MKKGFSSGKFHFGKARTYFLTFEGQQRGHVVSDKSPPKSPISASARSLAASSSALHGVMAISSNTGFLSRKIRISLTSSRRFRVAILQELLDFPGQLLNLLSFSLANCCAANFRNHGAFLGDKDACMQTNC